MSFSQIGQKRTLASVESGACKFSPLGCNALQKEQMITLATSGFPFVRQVAVLVGDLRKLLLVCETEKHPSFHSFILRSLGQLQVMVNQILGPNLIT